MGTQTSLPSPAGSPVIIRRSPRLAVKARTSSTPAASGSTGRNWHKLGNCRGLPIPVFFGEDDDERPTKPMTPAQTQSARQVCSSCLVRATCLADALAGDEKWGIWGGYNRPERERMLDRWGWDVPVDLRDPDDKPRAGIAIPHVLAALHAGTLDAAVRLL